ncbi:Thiosulfate reductase electron transfer subunit PhsB [Halodesulfovibrio sp. MK-HDV]|nr:Thiosulfate reductase electron transfer subunit PhsB [Halodesulfovibrio sp. MK-HDV]
MNSMQEQKTLFVDYSKCIGCETCEAVCRFLHDTPRIAMSRTIEGEIVPLYCQHCENAACQRVCKRGAISRDSRGAVLHDPMKCRGCETKDCLIACPYAAFFATCKGVAVAKCDLCKKRRAEDMLPACVEMCPCDAIKYVDREDIASLKTSASEEAFKRVMAHIRPKKFVD